MSRELLEKLDRAAALAKRAKYSAMFLSKEDTRETVGELAAYCNQIAEEAEL